MIISNRVPPCEHDSAIGSQLDELMKCGLDSALKLSLLSEAWILSKNEDRAGTVSEFALRLGFSDEMVSQELDQLAKSGYFEKTTSDGRIYRYQLTRDAPCLQTVRRLLSSWRDLRFYLRANAQLTFSPAPGPPARV